MNKEGFSLVELMIAIAISSIVLSAVVALIAYSTNSMSQTKARVALQDQAKDALNHVSAYVMEGNEIKWDETGTSGAAKVLTIIKKPVVNVGTDHAYSLVDPNNQFIYWYIDGSLYFGRASDADVDVTALTADKKHLLATDVQIFDCSKEKDVAKGQEYLHVRLKFADEKSEFDCEKDINLRNQ